MFAGKKTETERAVALAFPEMIGDDSSRSLSSSNGDLISGISLDDFLLGDDSSSKGSDGNALSSYQKDGTIGNGAMIKANGTVDLEKNLGDDDDGNSSSTCNDYLIDFEVPSSTPPTPATATTNVTTAHSEWLTMPPSMWRRRTAEPRRAPDRHIVTSRITFWESMCLAAIFFVIATCVTVVVTLAGQYNSQDSSGGLESVSEPTLVPTISPPHVARFHRLEAIHEWLETDFPLPGTPQGAALEWMVSSDFKYILGETIPSKAEYDLYSEILASNASGSIEYVKDEHKSMEKFRTRVTQRYALLVLDFATGMESPLGGWATLTGARLHECTWPGVVCRRDDDAVKALELDPSVFFSGAPAGSIPSEIGLLTNLGTSTRLTI